VSNFAQRLRSGFTDFKGIGIPPHAPAFVLTDRGTGVKYLVSFNTDGLGVNRLSINTVYRIIELKEGVRVYDANEGPYMDADGEYVLFIRDQRLGLDYNPYPRAIKDISQAVTYGRTEIAQREITFRVDGSVETPLLVHLGMIDG
jgi:hypothetical protein